MRPLIRTLNQVSGLRTTSCCFGHGEHPAMIFLDFRSIRLLNNLMWGFCYRWGIWNRGELWDLEIENGDTNRNSLNLSCCLKSSRIVTQADIDLLAEQVETFISYNKGRWTKYLINDIIYRTPLYWFKLKWCQIQHKRKCV
jgi:hypothetical protein